MHHIDQNPEMKYKYGHDSFFTKKHRFFKENTKLWLQSSLLCDSVGLHERLIIRFNKKGQIFGRFNQRFKKSKFYFFQFI